MTRPPTWALFAVCVGVWGTTWHAITYQIGHTAPAVGVAVRFGFAGLIVLAGCTLKGISIVFPLRTHAFFALQGVLLYGVSYVCVYHAERHLPSGLVSVGYSASPLLTGIGAWRLFGARLTRRFVSGGLLGLLGVTLIFWHEFSLSRDDGHTAIGAAFTVASVLLSTGGSLAASRNGARGLPFWPSLGFGMVYASLACIAVAWLAGDAFTLPHVVSWWVSLAYLSIVGSVLAFACYLALQQRVGPGAANTIGVMTPLLALAVSTAFEGYRPDLLTAVGAALAIFGNARMLSR
jgi:drug/metabolite transporter (DMT)-like permease